MAQVHAGACAKDVDVRAAHFGGCAAPPVLWAASQAVCGCGAVVLYHDCEVEGELPELRSKVGVDQDAASRGLALPDFAVEARGLVGAVRGGEHLFDALLEK